MVNGLAFPLAGCGRFFPGYFVPRLRESAVARPYAPAAMFAGSDRYGRRHTCINYELALWHLEGGIGPKRPEIP